jgi:ATP-dependent DNA helicase RecG
MSDTQITLDLREGDQVEFKEKFNDKCIEDACAFANTRGGVIFLGVDDHAKAGGVPKSDAFVQKVASAMSDTLGIAPQMEWRTVDGADVLVISVTATDWLVACKGRHLVRVGSTNRELSREESQPGCQRTSCAGWASTSGRSRRCFT